MYEEELQTFVADASAAAILKTASDQWAKDRAKLVASMHVRVIAERRKTAEGVMMSAVGGV